MTNLKKQLHALIMNGDIDFSFHSINTNFSIANEACFFDSSTLLNVLNNYTDEKLRRVSTDVVGCLDIDILADKLTDEVCHEQARLNNPDLEDWAIGIGTVSFFIVK